MLKLSSLAVFILASSSTVFSSNINSPQVLTEPSFENTDHIELSESSDSFDAISTAHFDGTSCQYSFNEANIWDFSGMKKYKYTGTDPSKPNETFSIDFCGSSHHPTCVDDNQRSACRYENNKFSGNLGSFSITPLPEIAPISAAKPETGISFTFTNGDSCGTTQTIFVFRLYCDMEAVEPVFTVSSPFSCYYSAKLNSKFGCPGYSEGDSSSLGWIFVIVLLSVLFLYFTIGFAICTKRYGKSGKEAIPHVSFWTTFLGLVSTGVMVSFLFLKSLCGSKSNLNNEAYGTYDEQL